MFRGTVAFVGDVEEPDTRGQLDRAEGGAKGTCASQCHLLQSMVKCHAPCTAHARLYAARQTFPGV